MLCGDAGGSEGPVHSEFQREDGGRAPAMCEEAVAPNFPETPRRRDIDP